MQQYILKLTLALAVVYLFYWVFLRRLTFYNWNRWYLLLYPSVCFLIPFVNVGSLLQRHGLQDTAMVNYIPVIVTTGAEATLEEPGMGLGMWALMLILTGSVAMLGRLLVQYLSLKRLLSSAILLSDGAVKLFHIDKKIIPFSTGNAIYINRSLHAENELREIIRHEFIHIKQRHSVDLWWSEVLCMLNWYNPFAWLIRKAIRQNLEYIADHQVLQSGLDRKQYQLLLLKVTGIAPFSFTSHFNFSSLKKRIVMMNKNKTAQVHLVRFLFIVPLLAVVLLAFRNVGFKYTSVSVTTNDTLPAKSKSIEEAFKEKGIKRLLIKEDGKRAQVTFSNGTVKSYDLTRPEVKAAFEKEYGELATPPPPPPAPPSRAVAAPTPIRDVAAPAPPAPVKGATIAAPPVPVGVPAPPAPPVSGKDISVVEVQSAAPPVEVIEIMATPAVAGKTVRSDREAVVEKLRTTARARVSEVQGRGEVIEVKVAPANMMLEGAVIVADKVEAKAVPTAGNSGGTIIADVVEVRPTAKVYGTVNVASQHALIEIKSTDTREQIDQAIQAMNNKGYSLELKNIQFRDGKLVSIDGVVGYGSSKSAFSTDSFSSVAIYSFDGQPDKFFVRINNGRVNYQY